MNLLKKALLTTTLIACTATVFAAPSDRIKLAPHNERPDLIAPPPAKPLYLIMQQTDSPNDALNSAVKNLPAMEKGKRYEVRLEVKELPAEPQATVAAQETSASQG